MSVDIEPMAGKRTSGRHFLSQMDSEVQWTGGKSVGFLLLTLLWIQIGFGYNANMIWRLEPP